MMAIDQLEKENGISKDELMKFIESALLVAYKKILNVMDENMCLLLIKLMTMHVYQERSCWRCRRWWLQISSVKAGYSAQSDYLHNQTMFLQISL